MAWTGFLSHSVTYQGRPYSLRLYQDDSWGLWSHEHDGGNLPVLHHHYEALGGLRGRAGAEAWMKRNKLPPIIESTNPKVFHAQHKEHAIAMVVCENGEVAYVCSTYADHSSEGGFDSKEDALESAIQSIDESVPF